MGPSSGRHRRNEDHHTPDHPGEDHQGLQGSGQPLRLSGPRQAHRRRPLQGGRPCGHSGSLPGRLLAPGLGKPGAIQERAGLEEQDVRERRLHALLRTHHRRLRQGDPEPHRGRAAGRWPARLPGCSAPGQADASQGVPERPPGPGVLLPDHAPGHPERQRPGVPLQLRALQEGHLPRLRMHGEPRLHQPHPRKLLVGR